ncbi:MAG: hypothetical protein VX438_15340, partial [Planctomycetota bacterium]|nr:hypothetical protein [Planctomycetota bacterium]
MTRPKFRMQKLQLLLGMIGLLICPVGLNAQLDHVFRSFSRSISPEELNHLLSSSNAVQKKIVSDKITDLVLEKFQNLNPEQKSR